MNNVWKIIAAFGGLDALKDSYIKLYNPGYMPLVIEFIGQGPRGLPLISVAHYYSQNGDAMRDPEMTFEVNLLTVHDKTIAKFLPVTYQQDGVGLYQEVVREHEGQVYMTSRGVRDLNTFARMWDRNIGEQGFVGIALQKVSQAQMGLPIP